MHGIEKWQCYAHSLFAFEGKIQYEFLSKTFQLIQRYVYYVINGENILECVALHLFIILNFPGLVWQNTINFITL